jgi:hypothetical protein
MHHVINPLAPILKSGLQLSAKSLVSTVALIGICALITLAILFCLVEKSLGWSGGRKRPMADMSF